MNERLGRAILVVEDDDVLRGALSRGLGEEGFAVDTVATGAEALRRVETTAPDGLVIDIGLPDTDGRDLCQALRARGIQTPVIFLTARDATADKVGGLRLGGDDYITKPFSLEELVARVRAVLRRTGAMNGDGSGRLVFADLELDDDTHEVWRGRTRIELTPTEYKLLRYLMLNARRALSKSQILDHVWEYDFDGDANVVETYISYLRKKIDKLGPPLIHTIRGVGYTLRTPPEG